MSLSGVPIGTGFQTSSKRLAFNHIPVLRELLGKKMWLGVHYAQVCIHNLKAAADRTEFPEHLSPIRNTQYYEIRGPKGTAQMALVGTNVPIGGANSDQGEPEFFTDAEVEKLTGLRAPIYKIRGRDGKLQSIQYLLDFGRTVTLESSEYYDMAPADTGLPDPDYEPPRHRKQKRKYVRKKPISAAQLAHLARAREVQRQNKLRNAHGRMTPLERNDGTQELEGAQAREGRGDSERPNASVQDGD